MTCSEFALLYNGIIWELLPTLSPRQNSMYKRSVMAIAANKKIKQNMKPKYWKADVAFDVPHPGEAITLQKCKSSLVETHHLKCKLPQVHKVCPEWTQVVLLSVIFSVARRSEGHFLFMQEVFLKAARMPRQGGSVFQQGGSTLLFLMHCQIQLELTFWAWLPSSGSASVCVAEAAS